MSPRETERPDLRDPFLGNACGVLTPDPGVERPDPALNGLMTTPDSAYRDHQELGDLSVPFRLFESSYFQCSRSPKISFRGNSRNLKSSSIG